MGCLVLDSVQLHLELNRSLQWKVSCRRASSRLSSPYVATKHILLVRLAPVAHSTYTMIRYDHLGPHDGARLRSIRLRALQDAPDAFGTTYEEASAYAEETWTRHAIELPTFVAVDNGRDVAMVRCARDRERPDTAFLISMWVAPEVRRRRIGRTLIDLVVAWARANDVSRLLLDVADLNVPAVALYASKGFEPTGNVGSLPPPREHIKEHQRELRVAESTRSISYLVE